MRRDVSLYWWGQTTSAFGSYFTAVAFPLIAVVQLNVSAAEAGLLTASGILPVLLFGLPLGTFADRIARPRRALVIMDLLSAAAVGVVALGLVVDAVSLLWLAALSAVRALLGTVSGALFFVHLRELVDRDQIGPARARLQSGKFGASLVGRSLAGPAVAVFGGEAALAVDTLSYLLSALALVSMRAPDAARARPTAQRRGRERRAAGVKFFLGDAYQRSLAVFLVSTALCSSGFTALTGLFLLREVGLPTSAYGLVFALSGLAGLGGSVVAGRLLGPGSDARRITVATFSLAAVSTLLLPLAFGPLPLAAAIAAVGVSLPVFFGAIANVGMGTALTLDAAEDELGRVMTAIQVFVAGANALGALAGGMLGQWAGVREALLLLGLGQLTVSALAVPPALRAARRLRAAETAEEKARATGRPEEEGSNAERPAEGRARAAERP
ncbi:MFS transporter [Streptomyces sp. JJ38]|uniref:MFS transporter n=1 Tax=Streptomyces sp. JJ38 TaxID=2738128 RepID=UPI001C58C2FA|nr:MFS transporter [Streptomyces sp. JJ38]MBW1595494.1 MFS transporter [Streptomyces sp. JJ38]